MNVLKPEEMYNLENILKENPELVIRDYKRFKRFEIEYLLRATRLPMYSVNYAIGYCQKRNLGKSEIIKVLCEEFNISEKEAENRLREVRKINNYESKKQDTLRLHK